MTTSPPVGPLLQGEGKGTNCLLFVEVVTEVLAITEGQGNQLPTLCGSCNRSFGNNGRTRAQTAFPLRGRCRACEADEV